ncbi:MAG TPA: radical SAM protein, partial [candidate division WOR-3 bacterium]|nr:radical SAM protein [candidate division WOR-3 bacterium]
MTISKIFHRDRIFLDPQESWKIYQQNPDYFEFPERITVELTNRCNLKCFMCPRNNVKMKLGDMSMEVFKKIIEEASKFLPVCLVPFFRGESLLHPRFIEMLKIARDKGLGPIQMATNAYFLDEKITQELLNLKIEFISFSIDVNDPQIYQKIRKHSDFRRVFSNILYFLEEKNKTPHKFPHIQVSAVKTPKNSPLIADFVEFWKDKVDRVRIYYAHSLNGKLGHLNEEEEVLERKPCLKLLTDIVIYWNGDIAICNHDWQRQLFIGNVRQDCIQDIWRGPVYRWIRQKHLDNQLNDF